MKKNLSVFSMQILKENNFPPTFILLRSITCFGACDAMWFDDFGNRVCEGKWSFTN